MRICGRILRPSDLSERRLFIQLGVDTIRVPRQHNPYALARRFSRLAHQRNADFDLFRLLARNPPPMPGPTVDTPEPVVPHEHADVAAVAAE